MIIIIITNSVKSCNGFGKEVELDKIYVMSDSDAKYNYIDHFYTKSLEEFVEKIKRGSAVKGDNDFFKFFRIMRYFNINKLDLIKLDYIIKKLNLTFFFN